jgi:Bcr/CflA subfamily drug resistance transporter
MRFITIIFLIIVITQALGQAMADIYLPSFPAIALGLNTNIHSVEFSLTIYAFGYGLSQLIYGPLSDGIGRRKPMLAGLFLCTIGSMICLMAPDIKILLLGRLCQGLGAGATLTIGGAMMRDLFEGLTLSKYNSYSGIIFVVFLSISPLLGGYIQEHMGWRPIFAVMTICSLLVLSAFIFIIPETNKYIKPENLQYKIIKTHLRILMTSPIFIGYTSCSLLTYGAIFAWVTASSALLENVVGLSPVEYGWVYAASGAAFAMGAFANSKLVFRFGINLILQIGLIGMLMSGVIMLMLQLLGYINTAVIAWPVILLLFSASLVFPNTSAGLFQPFPHIAGIASALFYASRLLGGALFSGLIAWIPHTTQMPIAVAFIVSALLSWIIFAITIMRL